MSTYFASNFDFLSEPLTMPIHVSTPIGDSFVVHLVFQACVVTFTGCKTWVDLFVLDMVDFEVIMGMVWLAS